MPRDRQGLGYLTEGGVGFVAQKFLRIDSSQEEITAILAPAKHAKGRRQVNDATTEKMQAIYWFIYYFTDTSTTVMGRALNRSRGAISQGAKRYDNHLKGMVGYRRDLEHTFQGILAEAKALGLHTNRNK